MCNSGTVLASLRWQAADRALCYTASRKKLEKYLELLEIFSKFAAKFINQLAILFIMPQGALADVDEMVKLIMENVTTE